MRDLHARMLAALLDGEGLRGIAELASAEAGSPIAIVLPARNLAAASSDGIDLEALIRADLSAPEDAPETVELAQPVLAGEHAIGHVVALAAETNGATRVSVDRAEILRTAALAAITEVAVFDARDEVAVELRGSLLEDLRSREMDGDAIAARAARLGCDLSTGAVALVAEIRTARPRHAAALITGEHAGALAEALPAPPDSGHQRLYALLPRLAGDENGARTLASARSVAARLGPQGPAAFSSLCEHPRDLGRAVAEAELMLDVIARDQRMAARLTDGIGDGVYRLLFRALASDPDEVRRFYLDTVEPLVEHDRQYRTDLLGTLEAYLGNDCNMNATARAVYAHRHTVAHRLSRIRELSGLDPAVGEDRERLGLGIKAYRILEPTLPK